MFSLSLLCQVTFVLDHFGKPDVKAHVLDPWREHLTQLAACPNVYAKLSGITTEADMSAWTTEDVAPYFAHAVAAFGPDRLVYGGDWPVCTQATTLPRYVETVANALGSAEALRKVFVDNPKRVYGL